MATQTVRHRPAGHVISRLIDYYLGVLPVAVEAGVETHLLSCARCLAEFDLMGAAAVVVATLPGDLVAAIEGTRPARTLPERP